MSEENKQEKEKSSAVIKIVNTVVCIGIVVSVCINVHQYRDSSTLKSQIAALESEIKTLETENDTLNKEIESKKTEESDLSKQIEDLQKKIKQLEADNRSLSDSLKALEDGINSTYTDVELGDDEYQGDTGADALRAELDKLSPEEKAEIDAALERAMKEHPEWFTDDSSGTSPAPYQGPAVGTPSTGELPGKLELDGDYSQYQGATVY